jgi:hypothetical protein
MHIIGGPTSQERNVIAGNAGHGLILGGRGHLVRGNLIGVNATGTALGNQFDGINIAGGRFSSATGTIGASQVPWDGRCQMNIDANGFVVDDARGCGNQIAFNDRYGVITGFNSYEVLSNAIFANGDLGLEVDTLGVTPNDPIASTRNYPELISWKTVKYLNPPLLRTLVTGSIENWRDPPVIIQVFHSDTCDPSDHGEGLVLMRTITVSGSGSFSVTLPVTGGYVTATSTPLNMWGLKHTSEFARCLPI